MTLHLIYRLYGGENLKGRPDFYNKRTSLASFLQRRTSPRRTS